MPMHYVKPEYSHRRNGSIKLKDLEMKTTCRWSSVLCLNQVDKQNLRDYKQRRGLFTRGGLM